MSYVSLRGSCLILTTTSVGEISRSNAFVSPIVEGLRDVGSVKHPHVPPMEGAYRAGGLHLHAEQAAVLDASAGIGVRNG
jgi:hypothetical protein